MLTQQSLQPDYELDDFTAVSDWERFTANVEECLREWSPNYSKLSPTLTASTQQQLESPWPSWLIRSCDIGTVANQRFELVRYWHESSNPDTGDGAVYLDLLDSRSDHDTSPHPEVYKLFGFHDFAILRVRQTNHPQSLNTLPPPLARLSHLVLSSLASAANAASWSLPMMLEIPVNGQTTRMAYTGISLSKIGIINLNATVTNPPSRPPSHMSTLATGHLCYWIAVMRNHLRCPIWPQPPIQLSVQYLYSIRVKFPAFDLLSTTGDDSSEDTRDDERDSYSGTEEDFFDELKTSHRRSSSITSESLYGNFCRLPFGIYDPPECLFQVALTWPGLDDSHFADSPVVSSAASFDSVPSVSSCRGCTLDPSTAIDWLARLKRVDQNSSTSRTLLNDCVSGFAKMANVSPISSTFEPGPSAPTTHNKTSGTDGHWSMRLVKQIASVASVAIPSPNFVPELVKIIVDHWIFPKTHEESKHIETTEVRDLKASLSDSLIERVAVAACVLNASFGQSSVTQFWQAVCTQLQSSWESGHQIPRTDSAIPPDLKNSILAQKIQLLAYCIGQRIRREQEVSNASSAYSNSPSSTENRLDGRLRLLDTEKKIKLLSGDDYIYIPETQEPEPVTEDELPMLSIETENVNGVGLQHSVPCLQSDMCSFKAANPGAVLVDFLQWYSPRDVQINQDGSLSLSSRMLIEDNIWQTTWSKAQATPARRQKRLFDETRAAHGVLRFLTALGNSPRELSFHLLPVLLGASLRRLLREAKSVSPSPNIASQVPSWQYIKETVDAAREAVVRATDALSSLEVSRLRGNTSGMSESVLELGEAANSALNHALTTLGLAEQRVCLLSSLRAKLSGALAAADGPVLDQFLCNLVSNFGVDYNGTAFPAPGKSPTLRGVILSLISSEVHSPTSISAVIRSNCSRPAVFSRSMPHRLFVRFQPFSPGPSCTQLASAFSRDIVFA